MSLFSAFLLIVLAALVLVTAATQIVGSSAGIRNK